MIKNSRVLVILLISGFFSIGMSAQEKPLSLDKGSVKEQFNFIFKKSSNYQNYKVVKRVWLQQLEKHIADSLQASKSRYNKAEKQIIDYQATIDSLNNELKSREEELATVEKSKDHILFLGISFKKSIFKTIFWSIIALLSFLLLYLVYLYKNNNKITKKTVEKYNELEQEYSTYRTRALEREQVLNRKLQDEINKQKKA